MFSYKFCCCIEVPLISPYFIVHFTLKFSGLIVLKDNVLLQAGLTFLWDLTDSSVARHKTYFKVSLDCLFSFALYVAAHLPKLHVKQCIQIIMVYIILLFSYCSYAQLLLSLAGLQVVAEAQQTDFPEELFPVMMWAIAKAPLKLTA